MLREWIHEVLTNLAILEKVLLPSHLEDFVEKQLLASVLWSFSKEPGESFISALFQLL
jgi:hypothetical protein